MCIAIYKPKNVELPTEQILKNCFEANDDGAGFAFACNNRVYIKKGFMTFQSFMDAWNANNEKYHFKDLGMLIHFRIHTHGANDATMTHPFPITSDEGALSKPETMSDYAVVHNGIITLTSTEAARTSSLSDTAVFIRDYLNLIARNKNWFHVSSNIELIEHLIGFGSKMAILNRTGEIIATRGFTEDNGIFYSNSSYKESYSKVKSYDYSSKGYAYSDYDYDDTDYSDYNWDKHINSVGKNNSNVTKSIGLMKADPGDTLEYDGFSQYVEPENSDEDEFYMDSEHHVYVSDRSATDNANSGTEMFYLLGVEGKVYDKSNKEREFKATKYAWEDQFPEL